MIDMPQQRLSYPLRMSKALRDQLTGSAKKNNRSMNAEIISRLEASYDPQESAVEREYRPSQDREKAPPGIQELLAGFASAVQEEVERQARELVASSKLKA